MHRPAEHGGPHSAPAPARARDGAPRGGRRPRPAPPPLDFSSSVSPLGPPPAAAAAMARAAAGPAARVYPDPESSLLREALAGYAGAGSPSNVVVGCGATEIIYNFCRAFAARRARVLVQAPSFGEYEAAARLAGAAPPIRLASMDLAADLDRFAEAIPRNGCAFVCTPNNPTGGMLSPRQVLGLASAAADASAMLLVDECFVELADGPGGGPAESAAPAAPRRPGMVVLRSLTKSFGLAGARVGYAVCGARTAAILSRIKVPWSVSGPAQAGALEALRHAGHVERARRLVSRERDVLVRGIDGTAGLECVGSPRANFVLVRTARPAADVRSALLGRGILVRDCSSFVGLGPRGGRSAHHIRVAVRAPAENKRLVAALRGI